MKVIKVMKKITAFVLCILMVFSVLSVSGFAASNPAAPSKVKVTAVTAKAAKLAWTSVKGASGYRVFVYYNNAWKIVTNTTSTSYIVSGLKASMNYTFAVKSMKKVNGKLYLSSNYTVAKTKTKDLEATKLSGTAGVDYVSLSWTKVAGSTRYQVYMHDGSGWKFVTSRTKLYGKVSNLKGGKTYKFAVRAISEWDGKVVKGPVSNYLKIKTTDPNKVTVKCTAVTDSSAKLKWTKAGSATGYRVFVYQDGSWVKVKDISNADTLTYTVKNLESDKEYRFRVRAFRKTSSGTKWYTVSDTCKAVTNPGIKDVELYRVNELRSIFESESYTFSYKITDEQYGYIPVTIAKNGDEYYLRTLVNERPYVLLNKADGTSYILLEENKSYIKVPSAVAGLFDVKTEMENLLPTEDWQSNAYVGTYNSQKVVCESYKNTSTGVTVKFFFKLGKFIGIEESGVFGVTESAQIESMSTTSDASLFGIPDDYQRIFFGTADLLDFAIA